MEPSDRQVRRSLSRQALINLILCEGDILHYGIRMLRNQFKRRENVLMHLFVSAGTVKIIFVYTSLDIFMDLC